MAKQVSKNDFDIRSEVVTKACGIKVTSNNFDITVDLDDENDVSDYTVDNYPYNNPLGDICQDGLTALLRMDDDELDEMVAVIKELRKHYNTPE